MESLPAPALEGIEWFLGFTYLFIFQPNLEVEVKLGKVYKSKHFFVWCQEYF